MESSPEGQTMSINDQTWRGAASTSLDRIGKVFVALGQGMRRCFICDGVFTTRQAAEHATAPCCVVLNGSSDKSVC